MGTSSFNNTLDEYLNDRLGSSWCVRDTVQAHICHAVSDTELDIHACARDPARKVHWGLEPFAVSAEDNDGNEDEEEEEEAREQRTVTYRFSHRLLSVWRKQPSPCCAGAALSCCINALHGQPRDGGLSVFDGCGLIADATQARGDFFARGLPVRLGVSSLEPLLEAVKQQ